MYNKLRTCADMLGAWTPVLELTSAGRNAGILDSVQKTILENVRESKTPQSVS